MQTQHSSPWLWGLFFLLLCNIATLTQAQNKPTKPTGYAPDRVLIAFEQGTQGAEKKALHAKLGASVLRTITALGVDVVQVPAGTVLEKIKLYDKNPNVRYAEPDYYRLIWLPQEGAEPFSENMFNEQWALHNTGQKMTYCDSFFGCLPLDLGWVIGTAGADINALEAWNIGRSNANIKIAILDSGIDETSLDLVGKYIVAEARNFVSAYEDTPTDLIGHGTHVAGIAAAECDNNEGIAGVACSASLVSMKVCYLYQNPNDPYDPLNGAGVCPVSAVAEAIAHTADPNGDGNTADHFDVVNMSFGTDIVQDSVWKGLLGKSQPEEAAVNFAFDAGVVLVAAAGNDGTTEQLYPAGYDNVIAVGATDEDDFRASFSNYGPSWVSVGAPGNYIWSTMPNALCGLTPPYSSVCLWPLSGTSMASPHVAGAAAVVLGYLRDEYAAGNLDQPPTNAQVRCHIEQGANQMGVQGLDYSASYFKYGRLNLAGALQYIAACDDGSSNSIPIAPSGLTPANSYTGNGRNKTFNGVYLSWTNNANNAENNLLQRCDSVTVSGRKNLRVYNCVNGWSDLSENMPANQSTYFDGLPSTSISKTYLYRIQASNGAGPSPWSNEAGIITPAK